MSPLFACVRSIAKRRAWIACVAVFALAAGILGFVPLFSTVGLEFSLAFSLPGAFAAGLIGIAVARDADGRFEPLALWAGSLPVTLGPLLLPLLIGLAHGLHVRNCSRESSLLFWLLVPVGSALLASAIGIAIAEVLHTTFRRQIWILGAVIAVSVGRFALGILEGPVGSGGNHFFGWYPGPLYDEAQGIAPGLWYLRLLSVILAVFVLLAAGALTRMRGSGPRLAALAVAGVVLAVASSFRQDFKLDLDSAAIRERVLGGTVRTAHFDIYCPAWYDAKKIERVARDHEFRLAQACAFLGVKPSKRITSYYYPSQASKKEWTGAGNTQIANPWKREIYVNDESGYHGALEHEITHVVSAEFGGPLIRISVHHGVIPNLGLIEGVAVATDWHDNGEGTPHEQCAAMLRENLLPDPKRFLGLGFWTDRGARSYTAAGSFARFLIETYGAETFEKAYAWSSFESAYGKDVAVLSDEWRAFLSKIPVPPKRAAAAKSTFTRPSIFEKPCARELGLTRERADKLVAQRRFDEAISLYRYWETVDGGTTPMWSLVNAFRQSSQPAAAAAKIREITEREVPDSPGFWWAKLSEGDAAWEAGHARDTLDLYSEVFSAHVNSSLDRAAWVRRASASLARGDAPADRSLAATLHGWIYPPPGAVHEALLVSLTDAATRARDSRSDGAFVAAYLLGRDLNELGTAEAALPWLDLCAGEIEGGAAKDSIAIRAEVFAMLGDARMRAGLYAESAAAWDRMLELAPTGELADRARDGAARTAWTAGHADEAGDRAGTPSSH